MPIPAGSTWPYVVTLDEVKLHGNITTATSDDELTGFIGVAQQVVEDLVGITVPQTFIQTAWLRGTVSLKKSPVLSVTSVTERGLLVPPSRYWLDTTGTLSRIDGLGWYAHPAYPLTVVYQAGRVAPAESIRWGVKELTIHLWRSTQAQRGGRGRGDDTPAAAAAFGVPNRVRDVLFPFLLPQVDVF